MSRYGALHQFGQNYYLSRTITNIEKVSQRLDFILTKVSEKDNLSQLLAPPEYLEEKHEENSFGFGNLYRALFLGRNYFEEQLQDKQIESAENAINAIYQELERAQQYFWNYNNDFDRNGNIANTLKWKMIERPKDYSQLSYISSGIIGLFSQSDDSDDDNIDPHEEWQESKISYLQREISNLNDIIDNIEISLKNALGVALKEKNILLSFDLLETLIELEIITKLDKQMLLATWEDENMLSSILDRVNVSYEANNEMWIKAISESNHNYLALFNQYNIPVPDEKIHGFNIEHHAIISQNTDIIQELFKGKGANPNATSLAQATCWQSFYINVLITLSAPIRWLLGQCNLAEPYFGKRGTTPLHLAAQLDGRLYSYLINESNIEFDDSIIDANGKTAHDIFLERLGSNYNPEYSHGF